MKTILLLVSMLITFNSDAEYPTHETDAYWPDHWSSRFSYEDNVRWELDFIFCQQKGLDVVDKIPYYSELSYTFQAIYVQCMHERGHPYIER